MDENAGFPHEALKALTTYGVQGADSVTTCIVIEEVARVDASAALIPAVNKLGKARISNGGASSWYTVMAVTDASKGPNGISAFMVHKDDDGFTVGAKERKLGIKGSPTTELYFTDCHIPGDRIVGAPGTGFKTALATLDHTVRPLEPKPSGLRRVLWMQLSHIPRSASSLGVPSRTSKPCSSCWLTWR